MSISFKSYHLVFWNTKPTSHTGGAQGSMALQRDLYHRISDGGAPGTPPVVIGLISGQRSLIGNTPSEFLKTTDIKKK